MTGAIHLFFDALLVCAFLIAVIVIVGAIQFGLLVAWVNLLQHRYRRQQARRPGYITDEILGPPWRHR